MRMFADFQAFDVLGIAMRAKRCGHRTSGDLTLRMVTPL